MSARNILILVLCSMLIGCGGGGAKNYNSMVTTTLGQELMDLQKAKEQGVLSDSEYDTQRKQLIERRQE